MKRTTLGIAALTISFASMAIMGFTQKDSAATLKNQTQSTVSPTAIMTVTPIPSPINPSDPTPSPTAEPSPKNPSDPTPTRTPKNPSDPTPSPTTSPKP